MGTVQSIINSARYDLIDQEVGLEYDNAELLNYINRMIGVMDSQLTVLGSDLVEGEETNIDTVSSQNYVDLTYMNNGYWDSVRSVWIGSDQLEPVSLNNLKYMRKFRSSDAYPSFYALSGRRLLFETTCDSAHTDLIIHYNKKSRPRLASYTSTFTANATTDALTLASNHEFVTGDGPVQVSNSGGALPTGLSASTNYWIIFDPDDSDGLLLATSLANALDGTDIDITDAGTGTHTITMAVEVDLMPYDGIFDGFFREMLVSHARGKRYGKTSQANIMYHEVFRRRAMEEVIRRRFVPKPYTIDF